MSARAWEPGDPAGDRRFVEVATAAPIDLEYGESLGGALPIQVAYETWGTPNAERTNAVLVLHALTGDSHAAGPRGPGHPEAGWWDPLLGPGAAIDTDRYFVVCPNVLGGCQGTTGPSSPAPDGAPFGSRFPLITVRDQVAVEIALADALGIGRWAAVVGGSMGGMRALEWAVMAPERVERLIVLACGASATAEQIALCSTQIAAIEVDASFRGGDYYDQIGGEGPVAGMGVARRIGQVSYRTHAELASRFGRSAQKGEDPAFGGRFAVESYLEHAAEKLAQRFDPNSYVVLSRAMNHHDVGRARGGLGAALERVQAAPTVIAVDSDRLYRPAEQAELAALLPTRPSVRVVNSIYGHDAFLVETDHVGKYLADALA
jgi:homoserine O-acetyltransferase